MQEPVAISVTLGDAQQIGDSSIGHEQCLLGS
jgi:hypothetical protein